MKFETLNESNFLLYAAKYYDNPSCYNIDEFNEDLKRFKYLKRLFNRYEETDELKDRLILNHIIILYNLFGTEAATRMLFYKMKGHYNILKPFLILLNYMPDVVYGVNEEPIRSSDILMDPVVINRLRKI